MQMFNIHNTWNHRNRNRVVVCAGEVVIKKGVQESHSWQCLHDLLSRLYTTRLIYDCIPFAWRMKTKPNLCVIQYAHLIVWLAEGAPLPNDCHIRPSHTDRASITFLHTLKTIVCKLKLSSNSYKQNEPIGIVKVYTNGMARSIRRIWQLFESGVPSDDWGSL